MRRDAAGVPLRRRRARSNGAYLTAADVQVQVRDMRVIGQTEEQGPEGTHRQGRMGGERQSRGEERIERGGATREERAEG